MSTNLIQDIKQHIGVKSTEELLDIWTENDREKWSVEYFDAIRLTLLERNEPLPQQVKHSKEPAWVTRNKKMKDLAKVFFLIGAIIYIFTSLFNFIIADYFWPTSPMIEILKHIRNALTLLCIFIAILLFVLPFIRKER
jgi:hypothetical protein